MYQVAVTEEDKRRVKGMKKKKKMSGKSVYFNRKKGGSTSSSYANGLFFSAKNDASYRYRSSYELKFYQMLEEDVNVESYLVEAFSVSYVASDKQVRQYIPDILVLYKNGDMTVFEVKPKEMLVNLDVQRKAQACKVYLKRAFPVPVKYKFITEEDLFATAREYTDFLKHIKKYADADRF